ncbi:MAG: dTMP kinase [Candidatus Omnitrophota bacterium]
MKKAKRIFITIEGPEGSGKSTHSKLLCDFLKNKGYEVVHSREPGGAAISESIRKILLDKDNKDMDAKCELLLFLAARAQIVSEIIKPALKRDCVVVCDRFHDATVAYQGYGAGIDLKLIESIGKFVSGGIKPELTILLDVKTEEGLRRAGAKDRMESKSLRFHKRVRRGYLALAKKEPHRVKLIRTEGEIEQVQDKIRKEVSKLFNKKTHYR